MDTSATTRMRSEGHQQHSEVHSTARSPAESWASALSRLKQLQLETQAALEVVQ